VKVKRVVGVLLVIVVLLCLVFVFFLLRRFVKNLSSNQINLSALKGEGELSSINLDETALEDVTELPTWLKIQKATCGRVFIKVRDKCQRVVLLFCSTIDMHLDTLDKFENVANSISE
jgi:hypothetical protein